MTGPLGVFVLSVVIGGLEKDNSSEKRILQLNKNLWK